MKMTKKVLVVITLAVLLVASLATTAKAATSSVDELKAYLNQSHTICGKTYQLTADQKKVAEDYFTQGNVTNAAAQSALANLKAAENSLNSTGAKSLNDVPADVLSNAVATVQKAGASVGVNINVNSNSKVVTVSDSKGAVLASATYTNINNGTTGSANLSTYTTIDGDNQTYNLANERSLKFRFDVDYAYFKDGGKVYMDGKLVDAKNYTSEAGSTIIKFKFDYAKKLALGDHTVKVEFNNGKTVSTKFKVVNTPLTTGNAGSAPAAAQPAQAGSTFVYTGSEANVAYVAVSLLAVVAVSIAFVKKVYVK